MTSAIQGAGAYVSRAEEGGLIGLPYGYVFGCLPALYSLSELQISVGAARSDDNTDDIVVTSPIIVDVSITGAGGRNVDRAETADSWYAVCLIKNPTTGAVAGFLIHELDLGSFTWPTGYTLKRRVAWWRNNTSSNFISGRYSGVGVARKFTYDVERTTNLALSGGSATTYTDIYLANWIPPNQTGVDIIGVYDPYGTSFCNFRPKYSGVTDPCFFSYQSTAAESFGFTICSSSTRYIQYKCFNALDNVDVYVQAFYDDLVP